MKRGKVGNNDACPCGSGKKFKKCHKYTAFARENGPSADYLKQSAIFLSFADVFPGEVNSDAAFVLDLQKFRQDELIEGLARLNFETTEAYGHSSAAEIEAFRRLADDQLYRQVRDMAKSPPRRLFTRYHLLGLMLHACRTADQPNALSPLESAEYFRRLIFRMSDQLERDTLKLSSAAKTDQIDREVLTWSFFRNQLLYSRDRFVYSRARYYEIYFNILPEAILAHPREAVDFQAEFTRVTGGSIKTYMTLLLALWSKYYAEHDKSLQRILSDPSQFYVKTAGLVRPELEQEAQGLMRFASSTYSELRQDLKNSRNPDPTGNQYFDIEILWRAPFYLTHDQKLFMPLDHVLLEERATLGIKWIIHDAILAEAAAALDAATKDALDKKRKSVLTFHGRLVERYVERLLDRVRGQDERIVIVREGGGIGGADFLIYDRRYPKKLIAMEVTCSSVRLRTAMLADPKKVRAEIEGIFFAADGRKGKGKMPQLHDTIVDFRAGRIAALKDVANQVEEIYPILVMENRLPTLPPLLEEYRKMVRTRKLLPNDVERLQFVTVDELEHLEPLLKSGVSICSFFEEKIANGKDSMPLKNYLYYERPTQFNDVVAGFIKPLVDGAHEVFTGDPVQPE